jgi:hypothetical protein
MNRLEIENRSLKFPSLIGWADTARGLHRAAQILGAIRMLTREPLENYLELALRVEANGLSSESLPSGGSVALEFAKGVLVVSSASGQRVELPISDRTQAGLLEMMLETLQAQRQPLVEAQDGSFSAAFVAALHAKGHMLDGSLQVTNTDVLQVDLRQGASYGSLLWRAFTAVSRWRARLTGFMTPVVVWAEHFDLSTLWFATEQHNENAPQMNFGFAPFDAEFSQPYLYAYAYPMPENFEALPLPTGAHWHTQGWKGMVLPYDVLEQADDPETLIETTLEAVYQSLAPSLKK